MPKSLNDNIENWVCFGWILSCSHLKVTGNYKLNKHARWISNLLLCAVIAFWIRNPVISMTHRKEVPSLSLQNSSKLIICTGHEMIPRPGAYWILMEKYIHMLLQLEVGNYHNILQPVSRGHLCTSFLQQNWVILGMAFPIWISFWCLKTAFDDPKLLFQTGFFQYVE